MQRISARLLPFLLILYIVNYLDRTNVSIAALQMNDDLRFSPAVFGIGAGIFFLGYALFEVPSNLVLARVGPRLWIGRIMITWGILAAATMWVRTPSQFFVTRFLLGLAEAGFYPGVIFYLRAWFPETHRARAVARFSIAIPLAQVVSGAIGGGLLALNGVAGLSGWQWLFLLEGLPSVALGVLVLFYLPDGPGAASWLKHEQQDWLAQRLDQEVQSSGATKSNHGLASLANPLTWGLAFGYFAYFSVGMAYTTWAPLLVRGAFGLRDLSTMFITAAIAAVALPSYLVAAARSDRTGDRAGNAALGLLLGAAGCFGAALFSDPNLRVLSLAVIPISGGIFLPSFWCLPSRLFAGNTLAVAIAAISSVGSTGGFAGPYIIGAVKQAIGGDAVAFVLLAGVGVAGSVMFTTFGRLDVFRQKATALSATL